MSLLVIGLIVIAATVLLLYVASAVLQSLLYESQADHLPVRALAAGLVVGGFLTFWIWIDSKNPGRYETIFSFSSYDTEDAEFVDVVRKVGTEEVQSRYTKRSVGSRMTYFNEANQEFRRADSEGPAIAVIILDKDKHVRYSTKLDDKGNFPPGDVVYREEGGKRYIEGTTTIGRVYIPGFGKVVICLLLNFGQGVLWVLAFWLGTRFGTGHAVLLGFGAWLIITLLALPVLFEKTRKPMKALPPPAATREVTAVIVNESATTPRVSNPY